MKKAQIFLVLFIVLIFASACGISEAEMQQTEEAINSAIMAESTGTAEVKETSVALTEEYESQMAETAQAVAATEEAGATATAQRAIRQVQAQQTLDAATQEAIVAATAEASDIYTIVQTLYEQGQITTANGYFQDLPEWSESYAQMWTFDLEPVMDSFATNFVLVIEMSWEIEDPSTDWGAAGCGVAFRISEDFNDYYTYFLTMDEQINFFQVTPRGGTKYTSRWDDIDPMQGSTTLIITVEGSDFKAFNENFELKDLRNGAELADGYLAYMIVSGSNKAPGTQCEFTNVDLWHLEN